MKYRNVYIAGALCLLVGCGVIEKTIQHNDDRYARPGAMDSPLVEAYLTYQFKLLDRYQITHQWLQSACRYRGLERPSGTSGQRSRFYVVDDIYEDGDVTRQRNARPSWSLNSYVRSVTLISKEKGREGQPYEAGLKTMCFEYWWTSSHFLSLRLHKRSVAEFEAVHTQRAPDGQWRTVNRNGMQWRVQQVPLNKLQPPLLNGLGGPYQVWLAALGDTGYTMAFEMGASTESLKYPQAHAALEKVYLHLIDSLKVERLQP